MKQKIYFLIVFITIQAVTVQGQERISRFIPQLLEVANKSEVSVSQGNRLSGSNQKVYSVNISENPSDCFGKDMLDSLKAAFKEEMTFATESDHYEKHVAGHDSITFVVAYGEKSNGSVVHGQVSHTFHHYYSFVSTAILVLADNTVSFLYNSREPLDDTDPFYDQPLKEKVEQVAKMKGVKKNMVKRIRLGNAEQGSGEETVPQYEVPKEIARQVFDDFNKLITDYRQVSKQRFDIIQRQGLARIIFGEDFENTVYEISLTPDQKVLITVLPKTERTPTINTPDS